MANYTPAQLLEDFSLEMTGKDVPGLLEAAPLLPKGTRVNVTFLGNEDLSMRLIASKAVLDGGFIPVPHISARRLSSQAQCGWLITILVAVLDTEGVAPLPSRHPLVIFVVDEPSSP
jgi:methylenetetrahydrofolate reductase (NADPH)